MRRNDFWLTPPGGKRSPRRVAKTLLSSFIVGALSIGMAWAGAGLVPVVAEKDPNGSSKERTLFAGEETGDGPSGAVSGQLEPLQANQVYAGAAKVDIAPTEASLELYNGEWTQDEKKCETFGELGQPQTHPEKIAETDPTMAPDYRVRWHENTKCIYTGGYDLGPAHAVEKFDDEFGLHVRAVALSDGNDTVVLVLLDGAYYFAEYANMCNTLETHKSIWDDKGPGSNEYTQDCGWRQLQKSLAEMQGYTESSARGKFGIEPSSFFLTSSHAHAAPDFVGAWGGVPRWYMQQVEDSIRTAVDGAIDNMQPTFVEADEILYRSGNKSRRRHYHAAEESGYAWMRFVAEKEADEVCTLIPAPTPTSHVPPGQDKKTPAPTPSTSCTTPPPTRNAIATIGTYAAHPVNKSNGVAYADLSGVFAKSAERRFGGTAIYFQTGFGNMTSHSSRRELGMNLVDMLPGPGAGPQVTGNLDVRTVMRRFDQPVTNSALAGGGIGGIFDRPMEQRPSAVSISKNSLLPGDAAMAGKPQDEHMPQKRCNSASPVTVNSQISVARIGPKEGGLVITGGPGELFSNLTNTIKEENHAGITFPLSLVNDGLGYLMQSFETDHVARQAVGFVNGPLSEYEDAYSIDACFGDHVLEQTLAAMRQL